LELKNTNIQISLIEPGPIASNFRMNAAKAFVKHIDAKNSVHRKKYEGLADKLNHQGAVVPFTLPPEAVLKKVIHALESKQARAHYYVTFPTYLFAYLKRILSTRMLDGLLIKAGSASQHTKK